MEREPHLRQQPASRPAQSERISVTLPRTALHRAQGICLGPGEGPGDPAPPLTGKDMSGCLHRIEQSVRHQDRQIGGHIQNTTGNAAQHHFPETAVAVGAHHQHVAAEFDRGAHQNFAHVLAISRHIVADSRNPVACQALGQTARIRCPAEGWTISAENHDAARLVKQWHRRRHGSGGRPATVPRDGDGRADRTSARTSGRAEADDPIRTAPPRRWAPQGPTSASSLASTTRSARRASSGRMSAGEPVSSRQRHDIWSEIEVPVPSDACRLCRRQNSSKICRAAAVTRACSSVAILRSCVSRAEGIDVELGGGVNCRMRRDAQTVNKATTLIGDQEGGRQSAPVGRTSDDRHQYFLDHYCCPLQKP